MAVIKFLPWITNLLIVAVCLRQIFLVPFLSGRFLYRLHHPSLARHLLGVSLTAASVLLLLSSIISREALAIRLIILSLCVLTYLVTVFRGEGILAHGLLSANGWLSDLWVKSYQYQFMENDQVLLMLRFDKKRYGQTGRVIMLNLEELPAVIKVMEKKFGQPKIDPPNPSSHQDN